MRRPRHRAASWAFFINQDDQGSWQWGKTYIGHEQKVVRIGDNLSAHFNKLIEICQPERKLGIYHHTRRIHAKRAIILTHNLTAERA